MGWFCLIPFFGNLNWNQLFFFWVPNNFKQKPVQIGKTWSKPNWNDLFGSGSQFNWFFAHPYQKHIISPSQVLRQSLVMPIQLIWMNRVKSPGLFILSMNWSWNFWLLTKRDCSTIFFGLKVISFLCIYLDSEKNQQRGYY